MASRPEIFNDSREDARVCTDDNGFEYDDDTEAYGTTGREIETATHARTNQYCVTFDP